MNHTALGLGGWLHHSSKRAAHPPRPPLSPVMIPLALHQHPHHLTCHLEIGIVPFGVALGNTTFKTWKGKKKKKREKHSQSLELRPFSYCISITKSVNDFSGPPPTKRNETPFPRLGRGTKHRDHAGASKTKKCFLLNGWDDWWR